MKKKEVVPSPEKVLSGRGGFRCGAGRPVLEPTKQMRIPLGAVELVNSLLAEYRKERGEINKSPVNIDVQIVAPVIKQDMDALFDYDVEYQNAYDASLKRFNAMTRKARRAIISKYGSIPKAAKANAEFWVSEEREKQKNAGTR